MKMEEDLELNGRLRAALEAREPLVLKTEPARRRSWFRWHRAAAVLTAASLLFTVTWLALPGHAPALPADAQVDPLAEALCLLLESEGADPAACEGVPAGELLLAWQTGEADEQVETCVF